MELVKLHMTVQKRAFRKLVATTVGRDADGSREGSGRDAIVPLISEPLPAIRPFPGHPRRTPLPLAYSVLAQHILTEISVSHIHMCAHTHSERASPRTV